jgi:hypothetical protein
VKQEASEVSHYAARAESPVLKPGSASNDLCHRQISPSAYLRSIDDLEPVLDLFTPHDRTTTSIVHSAPVPPRPLPVPVG